MGKCSVVYHYCSLWLPGNKRGLVSGVLLSRGFFLWGDGWLFDAKHHYFSILPMQRRLEGKKKGEFKWSGKKGEKCSNSILAHFPFPSLPLLPFLPILHTLLSGKPPLPSSPPLKGARGELLACLTSLWERPEGTDR